jgi:hypothetical protein
VTGLHPPSKVSSERKKNIAFCRFGANRGYSLAGKLRRYGQNVDEEPLALLDANPNCPNRPKVSDTRWRQLDVDRWQRVMCVAKHGVIDVPLPLLHCAGVA